MHLHEIDSPLGRLGLVTTSAGLAKVLFETDGVEEAREACAPAPSAPQAAVELEEYFAGRRREFTVPLDFRFVRGFREGVLHELAQVPFGETITYGGLARAVGNPRAVRAVGGACAHNPLPVFIPCHRVLPASGTVGNYRGGTEAKRFLLALEGINV